MKDAGKRSTPSVRSFNGEFRIRVQIGVANATKRAQRVTGAEGLRYLRTNGESFDTIVAKQIKPGANFRKLWRLLWLQRHIE